MTRHAFFEFMQSQRRKLDLDWEYVDGKRFLVVHAHLRMSLKHARPLERNILLTMCLTAEIESGTEGTDSAYFVLELAWCFDRFVLRGTQVSKQQLPTHIEERMKSAAVDTRYDG
jgi:hypothetical protein